MVNINQAFVTAEGGYGAGGGTEIVAMRGEQAVEYVVALEPARPHVIPDAPTVSAANRGPGCPWAF